MRKGRKGLLLVLLLAVAGGITACRDIPESVEAQFMEANRLYEERDYEAATTAYRDILDQGFRSGIVYFNLGNALTAVGKTGEALVAYEHAHRLLPRNEDIRRNRDFVTNQVRIREAPVAATSATGEFLEGIYGSLNLREWGLMLLSAVLMLLAWLEGLLLAPFLAKRVLWAYAVLILSLTFPLAPLLLFVGSISDSVEMVGVVTIFLLAFLILVVSAIREQARNRDRTLSRACLIVFVGLIAASGVAFGAKYREYHLLDYALVVGQDVAVRRAPDPEAERTHRLPQGTQLLILRESDEWREVRLPDSSKGWVTAEVVAPL